MRYNLFKISLGTLAEQIDEYNRGILIAEEQRRKERLKEGMKKFVKPLKDVETEESAERGYEEIITVILCELAIALAKYPDSRWPWKSFDFVHQCAVMMEEAGEAIRAANNMREGGDWKSLYKELAQTAAMCIRVMSQVEEYGLRLDKESGSPLSDR